MAHTWHDGFDDMIAAMSPDEHAIDFERLCPPIDELYKQPYGPDYHHGLQNAHHAFSDVKQALCRIHDRRIERARSTNAMRCNVCFLELTKTEIKRGQINTKHKSQAHMDALYRCNHLREKLKTVSVSRNWFVPKKEWLMKHTDTHKNPQMTFLPRDVALYARIIQRDGNGFYFANYPAETKQYSHVFVPECILKFQMQYLTTEHGNKPYIVVSDRLEIHICSVCGESLKIDSKRLSYKKHTMVFMDDLMDCKVVDLQEQENDEECYRVVDVVFSNEEFMHKTCSQQKNKRKSPDFLILV